MRRLLLLGALAGLVGYPLLDESATSAGLAFAQTERAETRAAAKANAAERLELPERRGLTRTQGELFGAPPPPPKPITKKAQPPAPVAAAPVAPQVPYRFAGKVRKGSEEEVLISKGDVVFPVKAGDTLDGVYKVESISAERIDLVYLPLGTRDRIVVSSALGFLRLQQTRAEVAWSAVGTAIGAYEAAVRYAKEREQFGRPIGSHQLIQDLLVKCLGNITASLGMVVRVSEMQDRGEQRDEHSALAKAYATSRMRETVAWAREACGGNGIVLEYDVARFFADAEALYSYEGTREMNTLIVGRAITGEAAFV